MNEQKNAKIVMLVTMIIVVLVLGLNIFNLIYNL
jgi:hypothetical protein